MENNNNVVLFSKAVAYAAKKHAAQTRREGSPYIYHPLAVATMVRNMGFGIDYQIAAVLHDTLEDTDATEEELRRIFGNEVTDAVVLLTRKPGEDEEEYVSSILQNHIAAVVKNADKIHNLREVVCVGIPGSKRTEAEAQHAVRYLNKAIKYYMNRFSQALNDAIDFTRTKLHDWTVPDFTASVPAYTKEKMTLFMDQEVDPKLQEELPDFSLPCEKIQFIELDFSDICDPILYCFYDLDRVRGTYSKCWKLTHFGWVRADEKEVNMRAVCGTNCEDCELSFPNEVLMTLKFLRDECHYFQPGAKLGIEI